MAAEDPAPLRLSFAQVDVDGLELELPTPDGQREPPRVVLRNARRLAGRIVQGPGHLRVDRVTAEQLGLDALRLVFGAVVLSEEGKAVLEGVSCTFDRQDEVELDLEAAVVRTHRLTVDIPGFSVGARASFRDLSIAAQGAEGSFEAEALHLESFVIQAGKVRIEAPRIEAERLRLEWGAAGFRLEAHKAHAPSLTIRAENVEVELEAISVTHVVGHETHFVIEEGEIGKLSVDARFEPRDTAGATVELAPTEPPPPRSPHFDFALLDRLFGELKVDLRVDLEVPILGRRVATHRFRLPVDAGSVNFLQLEDDLSTLENAILNFAVRDKKLVLERGIPLIKARGKGKAILVWDLDDEDFALARDRDRVRLATMPRFRIAKSAAESEGSEPGSKPKIALRALGLENVELALRLEKSDVEHSGILPRMDIESLSVDGQIHPLTREGDRDGRLTLRARGLGATVRTVLNDHPVEVVDLRCAEIPEAELGFDGSALQRVQVTLEKLSLGKAERLPIPEPERPSSLPARPSEPPKG
ncbi:MAG: hypothetical protein H6722_22325 [Sandaracinus sp.]|nr:hypothetical protein [Sandaracinus sp.]